MFRPKRLLFAGGGTRCLAFLTTLQRLEKEQILTDVGEWWGTSAGALVATLLALTKTCSSIRDILKNIDFAKFRDVCIMNLVQLTSSWGLDDGISLIKEVARLMESAKPGSSNYTMSDIKGLNIVVADLNLHQTVVISSDNFPTLKVVDAIRASMSLPIFYKPFKCPLNGHYWVDGGLRAHFPWYCLKSEEEFKESLGFNFEKTWSDGPATFSEYMFSMLHFDEPLKSREIKLKWKKNIIWFESPPFPAWYVRLLDDDVNILERIGNNAFEKWFRVYSKTPEIRQSSSRHHNLSPSSQNHHTDGKSDNPQSSCPSQHQDSPRDSQSETRRPSRRWSW
jgi:predicted acylesterase/phospholipase RssA